MEIYSMWGTNFHDARDVVQCLGPQCWEMVPLAELRVGDVTGAGVVGSIQDSGWPLDCHENTMGEYLERSKKREDGTYYIKILRRDLLPEGFHEAVVRAMAEEEEEE